MFKILFPLTIIFIVLFIATGCQKTDCSSFKEGDFFTLINSDTIYISRVGNIQTEEFKGYKTQMKVEWISNCDYKLSTISEINRDSLKVDTTFKKYLIKILKTTATSYTYETRIQDSDFVDKNIMYRQN